MSMDVVSVHVYLALSREMKNLQFNVAKELRQPKVHVHIVYVTLIVYLQEKDLNLR